MGIFGTKKKAAATEADGTKFLDAVRAQYDELFARFVANAEEYSSVEEYTDALGAQAWEISETTLKQSYRNGVRKGQARRSAS
jgi:hypothetical protein